MTMSKHLVLLQSSDSIPLAVFVLILGFTGDVGSLGKLQSRKA